MLCTIKGLALVVGVSLCSCVMHFLSCLSLSLCPTKKNPLWFASLCFPSFLHLNQDRLTSARICSYGNPLLSGCLLRWDCSVVLTSITKHHYFHQEAIYCYYCYMKIYETALKSKIWFLKVMKHDNPCGDRWLYIVGALHRKHMVTLKTVLCERSRNPAVQIL